jgi:hypothetical protein
VMGIKWVNRRMGRPRLPVYLCRPFSEDNH